MYHAGIDYHKQYSIISIQNTEGQIVEKQRVEHPFPELPGGSSGLRGYFVTFVVSQIGQAAGGARPTAVADTRNPLFCKSLPHFPRPMG